MLALRYYNPAQKRSLRYATTNYSPWPLIKTQPSAVRYQFIHPLSTMSKSPGRIVEGVFAIDKPASVSSAQVIRNLQHVFNPSDLFAPWLEAERAARDKQARNQRSRRRDKRVQVKIGHGGTLDPMATGVLIMGVGKGTKRLQGFLECTKSYEATILFGAATDTYDTLGKVLRRAPFGHVTQGMVEESLEQFRGKIMQRPPLYSALRMDGKRLYEYAREGKDVPREIEQRPVEVKELEILEWLDGENHDFSLPKEEAESESQIVAEKVLHFRAETEPASATEAAPETDPPPSSSKRKRSPDEAEDESVTSKKPLLSKEPTDPAILMSGALPVSDDPVIFEAKRGQSGSTEGKRVSLPSTPRERPPAVKIRMTVTSGFYVRSLAHDLGEAVGSLACMSALVRTRQGEYELGRNVLEYQDIEKEEAHWAPKVEALLDKPSRRASSNGLPIAEELA